jgi:predicted alpha/beta-hydrolase family hydrolase
MFSDKSLTVAGYRGAPVPNTLFQQSNETSHLAILLPGLNYSCHKPLLYYSTRLFLAMNADVLCVEYRYVQRPDYDALPASEQARWLFTDVTNACQVALAQRDYRRITLVGKSLGTLAMGHALTTDEKFRNAEPIWLTPLLRNEELRAQIRQIKPRGLFVIGTADTQYDAEELANLQAAAQGEMVVIEGADHSLEIKADMWQSLKIIERIMRAVHAFVERGSSR